MQVEEATNRLRNEISKSIVAWETIFGELSTDELLTLIRREDAEVEIELKNLIEAIQEEQQPVTEMG